MNTDLGKQYDVLLVDDDEDEYIITRDLFRELGEAYRIHWLDSYDAGIAEILRRPYDVCILDYHLGEKTGVDFIREALTREIDTPFILLTGRPDREIDLAAMHAGASDFLEKDGLSAKILDRAVRYVLEHKKSEKKIYHLAFYDQLTDLPNRALFLDRLQVTLASANRHKRKFAVMFIDIDNFKRVNDTLGHFIGDQLIMETAARLFKCIRKEDTVVRDRFEKMLDTVARLGGDEFTILLSEIKEPENTSKIAERIQRMFVEPVTLGGIKIAVTMSIGISTYPDDGTDAETLIRNADLAMYDAKAAGKNTFHYFNLQMNTIARLRLDLENDLRAALDGSGLSLHYQPIVDIARSTIRGVEALLRWNHPTRGIVPPCEFIPVAEESGLILQIGEWVLRSACADYAKWKERGYVLASIAVNISPKQLTHKRFAEIVTSLVREYRLAPGTLIIEITENSFINQTDEVLEITKALRDAGISFSLDDFGTGFSSFTHLKRIPFEFLKIDRSYIANVSHDKGDATITSSIVEIGHGLGLSVVAEGIENKEQLDFLANKGCEFGQGFYFCTPLPAESIVSILKNGIPPHPDHA